MRDGGRIEMGQTVVAIRHVEGKISSVVTSSKDGREEQYIADQFISSMPLKQLIHALVPNAPCSVRAAADRLQYRNLIVVAVIIDGVDLFSDNWIYIHDPTVSVGRIQNFGNWSTALVSSSNVTCLGMEYFCAEGDAMWCLTETELEALARHELNVLGLLKGARVADSKVVRVEKAYPVYDQTYNDSLAILREYVGRFKNLQVAGRNGMHRYNNQDHSMMTGLLAARNICGDQWNLWNVNSDAEYHEVQ